jgi:ADP-heptose:LPS heptosyltransferase
MHGDKTIYSLNSAAVGDLIAAAPSVKYAIEKFHKIADYRVAIFPDFKEIFHFVPQDKIIDAGGKYPDNYAIRYLNNMDQKASVCRMTPSRMKLTHYGSINLLARVISDYEARYIPFLPADISHYGVDFSKAVVIITTYRDKQRVIPADQIKKIAEYVESKGLTPVYVGRRGKISIWKNNLAMSDFEYPGFGVDLMDKTTLSELASIMGASRAVVGMDSGPIHVAFTTDVPVVAGFTVVYPQYRIPYRGRAKTASVVPNILCNFCESDWSLNFWNFSKCPRGLELAECVTKMTADKFIAGLEDLKIF